MIKVILLLALLAGCVEKDNQDGEQRLNDISKQRNYC